MPGSIVYGSVIVCNSGNLCRKYTPDIINNEIFVTFPKSNAAKIFLQLKRGILVLLDLEIRYKGQFTPQPQFQGTLSQKFIEFLKKECDL